MFTFFISSQENVLDTAVTTGILCGRVKSQQSLIMDVNTMCYMCLSQRQANFRYGFLLDHGQLVQSELGWNRVCMQS